MIKMINKFTLKLQNEKKSIECLHIPKREIKIVTISAILLRPVNIFPLSICSSIEGTEKHAFLLFMSNTLIELIYLNKQSHIGKAF